MHRHYKMVHKEAINSVNLELATLKIYVGFLRSLKGCAFIQLSYI